ncbi:PREDICTED: relA-associated inhibitor, partial [Calidris pugnax]|uniref:relA-associated inhibitor n=1 Tax=Calidris pugnax TaxID=198806 RepID=UPI00071C3945
MSWGGPGPRSPPSLGAAPPGVGTSGNSSGSFVAFFFFFFLLAGGRSGPVEPPGPTPGGVEVPTALQRHPAALQAVERGGREAGGALTPPNMESYSPSRTRSPLGRRSLASESSELSGDPLGRPGSPRTPLYLPGEDRAPSPRPKVLAVPYEGLALPSPGGRAPSPRPHRPYEFLGLGGSPRPGEGGAVFFPERAPSPRPPAPPPYEMHGLYPSISSPTVAFRAQDDLMIKRRPQKSWNESDLDMAYEKKPPGSGGYDRELGVPDAGVDGLAPSPNPCFPDPQDGAYGGHSATLPRNYKVSPLAGERRSEGPFRRSGPGTLPRGWHFSQQPVSRIPVPPQGGRPPRHNPRAPQKQTQLPALPQAPSAPPGGEGQGVRGAGVLERPDPSSLTGSGRPAPPEPVLPEGEPELERLLQGQGVRGAGVLERPDPSSLTGSGRPAPPEPVLPEGEPELERLLQGGETEVLERPLSPTRLQPVLPPEAQRVPEFEEVARVLAEMPRPLKRRGSMEQCPGPALPPTRTRQYQQLITRLLHRPPRREETPAPGDTGTSSDLPPPTPVTPEARPPRHSPPPQSPSSPVPTLERRSALRDPSSPRRRPGARVRLNPLVLLLDAALTGELDVVQQAVAELNDPSQPNDEGITALHNAICGANYSIVDFLIASGANVNSPDSHGWTPLHCAASCNDTGVCVALVRHGAAIFATTTSDGSLAVEKCDPYREGYTDCYNYLTGTRALGVCGYRVG